MNTWTRMSRRGKAAAISLAAGVALAGFATYDDLSTPTPPSCAKPENQNGMSMNEQNDCLDQVSAWCQQNYPNELSGKCEDQVFGYVPGKPGDDSGN
jgi:hypothetical protein